MRGAQQSEPFTFLAVYAAALRPVYRQEGVVHAQANHRAAYYWVRDDADVTKHRDELCMLLQRQVPLQMLPTGPDGRAATDSSLVPSVSGRLRRQVTPSCGPSAELPDTWLGCWLLLLLDWLFQRPHTGPRRSCLLLSALLCTSAERASSSALEFEAGGRLHMSTPMPIGDRSTETIFNFNVSVKGACWYITMVPAATNTVAYIFKSIELASDGTNTYSVQVFNADFDATLQLRESLREVERLIHAANTPMERTNYLVYKRQLETWLKMTADRLPLARSQNRAVGGVLECSYPVRSGDAFTPLVWFAYCSSGYLDHQELERSAGVPPLWEEPDQVPGMATNVLLAVDLVREEAFPRLPSQAVFPHVGTIWKSRSPQPTDTGFEAVPLAPPLDRGYTNAFFKVEGITNTGDITLPAVFELTAYRPGLVAPLAVIAQYRGQLYYATNYCRRASFIPEFGVPTTVSDARTKLGDKSAGTVYLAAPGPWPTTTNTVILTSHERQILASIKAQTQRRRFIVGVIIMGITLSGFRLLLRLRSR